MKQGIKRRIKKIAAGCMAAVLLAAAIPTQPVLAQTITEDKPMVIVLDPGHGGLDSGATRKWNGKFYKEKDVNLAIAKACKEKLESFMGVKVYLTRSKDNFVSLSGRVNYASSKKADLFVALHNNASAKSTVKGACVYYPNANYSSKIGTEGKAAAQSIQDRLTAIGLKNNGIFIRNSENKSQYPDKSLADYYSVIQKSKRAGFPGLIVEHAYISNANDCTKYLGSSAMLTKLGEADALGIASCYGLIPKSGQISMTSADATKDGAIQLKWKQNTNVDGYCIYRRDENEDDYQLIKKLQGTKNVTYTDNTVVCGVNYEYVISGYHIGKNATSYTLFSNAMEAEIELPVPQNVTARQMKDGTWKLTWKVDNTKGVSGYRIERRLADEDDYEEIATVKGAEKTSYKISKDDVSGDATYCICSYYADKDYDEESEYSDEVTLE